MATPMWIPLCGKRLSGMRFKGSVRKCQQCISRCVSTQTVPVDERVEYPAIKPRFPPGKWGYMDPPRAWWWQHQIDDFQQIPSVKDRISKLCDVPEQRIWHVDAETRLPGLLQYQLYLTKTHLVKGLPEIYSTIDVENELESVRGAVIDSILFEYDALERQRCFVQLKVPYWLYNSIRSGYLVGQILQTVVSNLSLSEEYDCLTHHQLDENIKVAAHWCRHGVPKIGRHNGKLPRPEFSLFKTSHSATCQIRIPTPIPQFVEQDNDICLQTDYPQCNYYPGVMGLRSQFTKPEIVSGHWPEDPCKFGLISAHATNMANRLQKRFGPEFVEEIKLGYGVISSFAWQVTQAHYQGFSMYLDVTYPFCGQTILFDGKKLSFCTYQLNTLHLWKDDQSNPLQNICWHSEVMDLYDTVENGQVTGFNDDALRTILRFVKYASKGVRMDVSQGLEGVHPCTLPRPYITEKPAPPAPEEQEPLYKS